MSDHIMPLPPRRSEVEEEVFEIGVRTVRVKQDQPRALDDYGTYAGQSISPTIEIVVESAYSGDPLVRVEKKIDAALVAINRLQKRIDSIDAILAVVVNR